MNLLRFFRGRDHSKGVKEDQQEHESPEEWSKGTDDGEHQSPQGSDVAEDPHHTEAAQCSGYADGSKEP